MKICRILMLMPACRAGDDDAMMIQMQAAHSLGAIRSMQAAHGLGAIRSDCPPILADFLPQQRGQRVASDCSIWLEDCLDTKLLIRTRKRWRKRWRPYKEGSSGPPTKERWLEDGKGTDDVAHFMQDCGKTYCCGDNHRFADDGECQEQMQAKTTLNDTRLDRVYNKSKEHKEYPLTIISRMLCTTIKDHIASPNVQLLRRGARLHDSVTEGKGDVKGGAKGSNVSLASLSTSSDDCTTPDDMRPEGWDCKCAKTMLNRCVKAHEENESVFDVDDENAKKDCYMAQICHDQKVCPEWKNSHCNGDGVQQVWQFLQQHQGLLQRQEGVIEEATGLEASLGCKR